MNVITKRKPFLKYSDIPEDKRNEIINYFKYQSENSISNISKHFGLSYSLTSKIIDEHFKTSHL